MNQALLDKIESEQFRKDSSANFGVGDSVRVHTKVVEGDKERIQIFSGVVIGRRGRGLNEMFTVRRISYGEGVERVFPVHSPRVDKIEVERKGKTRRLKLLPDLFQRSGGSAIQPKPSAYDGGFSWLQLLKHFAKHGLNPLFLKSPVRSLGIFIFDDISQGA